MTFSRSALAGTDADSSRSSRKTQVCNDSPVLFKIEYYIPPAAARNRFLKRGFNVENGGNHGGGYGGDYGGRGGGRFEHHHNKTQVENHHNSTGFHHRNETESHRGNETEFHHGNHHGGGGRFHDRVLSRWGGGGNHENKNKHENGHENENENEHHHRNETKVENHHNETGSNHHHNETETEGVEVEVLEGCDWVAEDPTVRCTYRGVSSSCPATCGTCDMCQDARLGFKLASGRNMNCRALAKRASVAASFCADADVTATCRKTCGTC